MNIPGKLLLGGGIIGFLLLASGCLANNGGAAVTGLSAPAGAAANTAPIGDACSLVTPAEASLALGEAVGFAESSETMDALGHKSCVFKATASGSKRMVELGVVQNTSISTAERKKGTTAATEFEKAQASFAKRPGGATPVANAGDSAFWNGTRLYVLRQDVLLTLLVGDESSGNMAATTPLARAAAKRIK